MAVIETEGLSKDYGSVRALVGLNLEAAQGEVFGFLGPNGAGKTTTIRLLLDLIRPTKGRALIFGLEVGRHALALKSRIGYLPGELALYSDLTARQLFRYLGNLRGGTDWPRVRRLADLLELPLDGRLGSLSHGTRQKAGLAQALMHSPELLILDEPTTGLDPLAQQVVYSLLDEARKEGRTIFFSSHVLPEVEHMADRVAIVRKGRLVANEAVSQLKKRAARWMEITFAQEVPLSAFAGCALREVSQKGNTLRFLVRGSLDSVIKAAARFEVVDMRLEEPRLEDVFMAYYSEG